MDIFVYLDNEPKSEPRLVGTLKSDIVRGNERFIFSFSDDWLNDKKAHSLDPDLFVGPGPQYPVEGKQNFGLFLDSSPDRWGELLIRRRHAILARESGEKERHLYPSDMLLNVFDETRMGALRFKTSPSGDFLNNDTRLSAPPLANISDLQHASWEFEKGLYEDNSEEARWLAMLYAPGSSLGGARPKANITQNNELWIAKFPSRNDRFDVALWEMVAHRLAVTVGIEMAECAVRRFNNPYHTFLTKRFDRVSSRRVHFASAMTLLGRIDGKDAESASYLDIAEFIMENGAAPDKDLRQLWTRIVFSIAISNSDDHLRNHGFLLTTRGWQLSPAYDLNPNPSAGGLHLNIDESNNSLDFSLALDVADYFRVKKSEAESILKKVRATVSSWPEVAKSLNASRPEISAMAKAFRAID